MFISVVNEEKQTCLLKRDGLKAKPIVLNPQEIEEIILY